MLTFIKLAKRLDYFIFESFKIKPEYLGLYRILYCLCTFLFSGIPTFGWIGKNPDYLFEPPKISIANLFNGFPDPLIFNGLSILIAVLYLMLLFGWYTKLVSLLLFFSLLFCYSFTYSFGKIDHNILWLLIPFVMAFSGWGNSLSIDATMNNKSQENAWAISLMALLLGFAMFTASLPKITHGWLSLNSSATKSNVIYNHYYWGRTPLLLNESLTYIPDFVWELLDYLTIIFEFGFLLVIFYPLAFRIFVIAAVLFHISIFLTMNISFGNNLYTYLLFINWSIFSSFVRSNFLRKVVNVFFRKKYLFLTVLFVLIFGIFTLISGHDFKVSSPILLILQRIYIDARNPQFFITFGIASVLILFSIVKYIRNHAKVSSKPYLNS